MEEPEQVAADGSVMNALKAWQLECARREEVAAFVVFHNRRMSRSPRP